MRCRGSRQRVSAARRHRENASVKASLIFTLLAAASAATPALAQSRRPVQYVGLSARTAVKIGQPVESDSSVVVLRFRNPNGAPAEVRNTRCEFHNGRLLVAEFTIPRISVPPGDYVYEAPQTIQGRFNRARCKPGQL
jgi:hypothetical protein